jgi:ADP-ribose pyrophosphatase YjhB (NUDIX family)
MVPSVNVVVANSAGEVLLIRRSDNDNWALPGGAIDLGESARQAAVRETKEETGIDCEITGLVGIYTDPKHIILYTSHGRWRESRRRAMSRKRSAGCRRPMWSATRWTGRCDPGSVTIYAATHAQWSSSGNAQPTFGTSHARNLAYSALFLAEDAGILASIADKARSGVRVRARARRPRQRRRSPTRPGGRHR